MVRGRVCFFIIFVIGLLCSTAIASDFEWPSSIPKCKPGDETCIPQTLTQLFRHSDGIHIPGLNIPKLEPFTWSKGTVVRTRNPNAAINVIIRNSHTVIHGLKTMEVIQIKGFGSDPRHTKFEIKTFIPLLTTISNYRSTMNLFALPITTEGVSNTTITNLELRQIIDANVIEKNGKDYIDVKNVRVHLKVGKLSIHFDSKTGNPDVNETINKVINDNWREIYGELKPDLEKNIGEVIKSIIAPMFRDIPYHDFFLQPN